MSILYIFLLSFTSGKMEAYFSPNGGVRNAIIQEMDKAQKTVDIAMYMFTNRKLAYEILKLKGKGIRVRIVLDGPGSENKFSKSRFLKIKGINVRSDYSHPSTKYGNIMHNKFAIIDSAVLITGSYNWTASAEELNDENILIVKDAPKIIHQYEKEFDKLWKRSKEKKAKKIPVINGNNLRQVRRYAGKYVKVRGKVYRVGKSRKGHRFLDFGRSRKAFTVVIWKEGVLALRKRGIDLDEIVGKTVEVSGTIVDDPKYGLEIKTSNPEDIKILK